MKMGVRGIVVIGFMASNLYAVATERFVSLSGAHVPPFTSWADAATNVQAAIDAAVAGDLVWVTNGIYSSGGKVIAGDLLNRVALDKALTVRSVNGPDATIIQGNWDATTNGPTAVRCAWLTNDAVLNGFTLQGGATRTNGDTALQNGGGVWGVSTQALVVNCWILTNAAASDGGGSFQATLDRCKVIGNQANQGGGGANGWIKNSFISKNVAATFGGGSYECNLNNCTITENWAQFGGGGGVRAFSTTTRNSILAGNFPLGPNSSAEYSGLSFNITFCSVEVTPPGNSFGGLGNISSYPQFTDPFHLAIASPCRGAGNSLYASGTDLDGETWLNPPSIGCDEVIEANLNGPLSVTAGIDGSEAVEGQFTFLLGEVTGRTTRLEWYFGDGSALTNSSSTVLIHAWTNVGDYTVTFIAYNNDFPNGVATNFSVQVVPLMAPTILSMNKVGTNCTLNILCQPRVNGSVERATNLTPPVTWRTVGSIYSASNLIQVIDRSATNVNRFYRVRIP